MEDSEFKIDEELENELLFEALNENFEELQTNEENVHTNKVKRRKHYSTKKLQKNIKSGLRIKTIQYLG